MAKIPEVVDPTLSALDAAIVERLAKEWRPRPYLGASALGYACERRSWLSFRWVSVDIPDALGSRRIEDGHRGEVVVAQLLNAVPGVTLVTHDEQGRQKGFVDLGGHLRGHWDGEITGLIQAPKTPHVWECKIVGEKQYAALAKAKIDHGEKKALVRWNEVYYAQAQLYMHYAGLPRHYLVAGGAGARQLQSVRTDYDEIDTARLRAKAERIIFSPRAPQRVSENPSWYQCQGCSHHGLCHEQQFPLANCRTCMFSRPVREGGWNCDKHAVSITEDIQRTGCPSYLYHPDLVPGKMVGHGKGWVDYEMPDGTVWRNEAPPQPQAQGAQA